MPGTRRAHRRGFLLASAAMDAARPIMPDASRSPQARLAARVTPMMEQYIEIKAANPDCLLFYRMGDFYEMFFDDAEIASRALGIVLTKRGKHLGRDIPMCGVPIERADEYLHRLIALGHRVAVCEQLEDPGRGAQARRQERGAPRRGAAGHARHADRRFAARRQAQQLSAGAGAHPRVLDRRPFRAGLDRYFDRRIPRRRMRPLRRSPPRSRASSPARSSSPTRFMPTPSWRRICARCRR